MRKSTLYFLVSETSIRLSQKMGSLRKLADPDFMEEFDALEKEHMMTIAGMRNMDREALEHCALMLRAVDASLTELGYESRIQKLKRKRG